MNILKRIFIDAIVILLGASAIAYAATTFPITAYPFFGSDEVINFTNGAAPSTTGALQFAPYVNTITFQPTTVSALPSCTAALTGTLYMVSDASSPTYGGTLTGGSTTYAMALCNGSTWQAN